MWSIGIWKPIDRKFGLRPWLRKSITTRWFDVEFRYGIT